MEIHVIGVPMDLGGDRRGVDMGPSAIRYAGLDARLARLGYTVRERGNLRVAERGEAGSSDPTAHYAAEIVRVCEELASVVAEVVRSGGIPLVLGGDHSMAIGTLAGLARAGKHPGVIWLDAHGDINTPGTSPSGNVHGMPLAVALGLANGVFPDALRSSVEGKRTALVAIRSIDEGEKGNIAAAGVTALTMAEIDRSGVAAVIEKALAVAGKSDHLHVSVDMDAIDPDEAPGVGTPVRGGLSYREAQLAMEMLAATNKLRSIEIAEVNPILDRQNRTAALAVELVASALGQTIL